ncbi:glycosyltransferase family A protein [Tenacibaculum sp. 47A_GOM-205m]|uniref:glycosyltransferase family 2 protein n=1 Tax=Tenacibaculum sp. 47A_GOM-205m TaxID=1380384 RepID=UPI00048D317F|nr:glycosyltransferase family A protein [Tenacibaculum sp. 47A_GOM-205m]
MKTITVFTPTYNRAYCLSQLYESLCRQTSDDFKWLIVDDGSTDSTAELIEKWIKEEKICINYHYKENGGMHTGHNMALKLITTELNMCIDSDDYVPNDSIEKIINFWKSNKRGNYAGILGLNRYKNGNLVSTKKFPDNIKSGKYSLLKRKFDLVGDVKFVYVTDVIKKQDDYPVFTNEKFVPLGYKYSKIDMEYDMLFFNETLCIVDYLPDGSTRNMFKQYYKNPKGFAFSRIESLKGLYSLNEKYIICIHLVAESLLSGQSPFYNNSNKLLTLLSFPFGVLLYFLILLRNIK